jgi:hypothetical protein
VRDRLTAKVDAGATCYVHDLGRYPSNREFAAQAETFIANVAT